MGTWVEVNDEDAAIAAGDRFSALGKEITRSEPPDAASAFGDDKFGDQMRENYPFETEGKIREAKQELSDTLSSSGSAVTWAVNAVTGQDREEGAVFTKLTPPDV